jgi:putative PIN family toxin of toxin-antitoxin system
MMRVVLDVNVLVSALISPTGPPAQIVEHWHNQRLLLLTSDLILQELERVALEPKLRRYLEGRPSPVPGLVRGLRRFAIVTPGRPLSEDVSRDPADEKFLACAVEGAADYLVTGDQHLLELVEYQGVAIVSPTEFVRILESK